MARILIADDEAGVREFVARALQIAGHEVTAVEDGLQALDAFAVEHYDLLLTDIVMPGLDGIALALKIGSSHPDARILLMSGYAAERQRVHHLDALVHRIIAKPFTLKEICEAVADTLTSRPSYSQRNGGPSVSARYA